MPSFDSVRPGEASIAVLINLFQEACARHDYSPDGDESSDLLVLSHTHFREALVALVMNLVRK
ncbi:hypothetical protein CPY51_08385 [Rhizobium tubonense]|uniref:Uncharacterized protein n=1 Tax=Rhizobium tubonense TaxID=484088 RepID=A0A2W4CR26_9HYPH|nr:hypothetical protein CPY51_08385 [Rhizobium tubonense]